MPGADYYVRQGDSPATLTATLLDANGDPVNIQGASVAIQLLPVGSASYLVDDAATNDQVGDGLVDGEPVTRGMVSYDLTDTDDAGYLLGTWVVTFGGGGVQSYPNGGFFLVEVFADKPGNEDAFATSSDLEERLGLDFNADEHVRASGLLLKASNLIRAATGQHISLVADDEYSTRGYAGGEITLPERPIVEVGSVVIAGTTIDAAGYYFQGDKVIRWGAYGWPQVGFGSSTDELVVTYTHGYEEIPGDIVAVCLEMVARVWANPGAVVSETVGNVQTTFSVQPVNGLLLTDAELATINRAIGQSMGSVQLR